MWTKQKPLTALGRSGSTVLMISISLSVLGDTMKACFLSGVLVACCLAPLAARADSGTGVQGTKSIEQSIKEYEAKRQQVVSQRSTYQVPKAKQSDSDLLDAEAPTQDSPVSASDSDDDKQNAAGE